MIDLEMASLIPLLPLSQTPDVVSVKPSITVISENEFLILSWTGTSTLGLFINGDGDPVRGTLEWPSHPESVCKSSCFLFQPHAEQQLYDAVRDISTVAHAVGQFF